MIFTCVILVSIHCRLARREIRKGYLCEIDWWWMLDYAELIFFSNKSLGCLNLCTFARCNHVLYCTLICIDSTEEKSFAFIIQRIWNFLNKCHPSLWTWIMDIGVSSKFEGQCWMRHWDILSVTLLNRKCSTFLRAQVQSPSPKSLRVKSKEGKGNLDSGLPLKFYSPSPSGPSSPA